MPGYTVGSNDPSISYLPKGTWNVTSADGVSLMQGGYPGQILYTFAVPASGFSWYACKSGSGGAALLCFDCDCTSGAPASSSTTTLSVNFTDPSVGSSLPPPTLLYQTSPGQLTYGAHNVCISNSFEKMEVVNGQEEGVWGWIFTYQFVLDTSDSGTSTTSSPTSTSHSSTSTFPTSTLPPASAPASPTSPPGPATPTSTIVGALLGGLAFLALVTLVGLYYLGHHCGFQLPLIPPYRGKLKRERVALVEEDDTPPTGSSWGAPMTASSGLWSAGSAASQQRSGGGGAGWEGGGGAGQGGGGVFALGAVPSGSMLGTRGSTPASGMLRAGRGVEGHARTLSDELRVPLVSPAQGSPAQSPSHSPSGSRTSFGGRSGDVEAVEAASVLPSGSGEGGMEPPSYDEALGSGSPAMGSGR